MSKSLNLICCQGKFSIKGKTFERYPSPKNVNGMKGKLKYMLRTLAFTLLLFCCRSSFTYFAMGKFPSTKHWEKWKICCFCSHTTYHIKGGLKRIVLPVMPAHPRTHLYRNLESTPPPPGTLNNIQTALQENIGNTGGKVILRKHMLKLGFTY